jgi:type III pantothenate kinase
MIVIAIDIGNTWTKVGIFLRKKLAGQLNIPSLPSPSPAKVWLQLSSFFRAKKIPLELISGSVISSVVPPLSRKFSSLIKRHLRIDPLIISGTSAGGLRIYYENPKTLGADRICSAVAAFHNYGGPVIVVDFGTATTYDVITKNGAFLGGAITPGLGITSLELHNRTAQLPKVKLRFPKSVIGKTTIESIQSGILYGTVDAMEGMIRRIKTITGKSTKVVLTGGFSHLIKAKSSIAASFEPSLVLQGARLIYEHVHREGK